MQIQIIKTYTELKSLESDWIKLHSELKGNVFQSFNWSNEWWNLFAKDNYELFVLTAWDNLELLGILPLFREKLKIGLLSLSRLRFIGAVQAHAEYKPLIHPDKHQNVLTSVVQTFKDELQSGQIDLVSFFGFSPSANFIPDCLQHLKGENLNVRYVPNAVIRPMMNLPENWDTYLSKLSPTEKTMLTRRTKSLIKYGAEVEVLKNSQITLNDYYDFVKLHTTAWEEKGFDGYFKASSKFETFLKGITTTSYDHKDTRLYFFKKGEERFAAVYAFFDYPVCCFYLSGMDPHHELKRYSPGKILLSYVIKDAIKAGFKKFDFQGGKETYKYQLGGEENYFAKAEIWAKSSRSLKVWIFILLQVSRQFFLSHLDYNPFSRFIRKIFKKQK
ncbi:MAG: GNAT family N-acetyltransferase [Bacteroidota bacterium]|nr:GNAT family N-acetyltransferase [Bacteroidota bacterium]